MKNMPANALQLTILNFDAERIDGDDFDGIIALRFPRSLPSTALPEDPADIIKSGLDHFHFEPKLCLGSPWLQLPLCDCIGYEAETNLLMTCDYRDRLP